MVVTVQQPIAKCTAIFTVHVVKQRPLPCAVTIHQTCLPRSTVEWIPKQCPHPRPKLNVLATHQITLLLAISPRSNTKTEVQFKTEVNLDQHNDEDCLLVFGRGFSCIQI